MFTLYRQAVGSRWHAGRAGSKGGVCAGNDKRPERGVYMVVVCTTLPTVLELEFSYLMNILNLLL